MSQLNLLDTLLQYYLGAILLIALVCIVWAVIIRRKKPLFSGLLGLLVAFIIWFLWSIIRWMSSTLECTVTADGGCAPKALRDYQAGDISMVAGGILVIMLCVGLAYIAYIAIRKKKHVAYFPLLAFVGGIVLFIGMIGLFALGL